MLLNIGHARERNPWHFAEDPETLFREHVYVSPFWEDDLREVISIMGPSRVVYGSDWPHMEGLPHPTDVLADLADLPSEVVDPFLYRNGRSLTERRPKS